jgi:hypothetical protein
VVVAKADAGQGNFGYNSATGGYGDLLEMGVIDPTKVTRTALQNAASVAGLILTTDATVAEAPKEEKQAAPAMPEMDYQEVRCGNRLRAGGSSCPRRRAAPCPMRPGCAAGPKKSFRTLHYFLRTNDTGSPRLFFPVNL